MSSFGYPAGRHRAGVIVLLGGRLALIDRVRPGSPPYSVVPGGGVEAGESFAEAAVREAKEELGLEVSVRSPAFVLKAADHEQQYFVAEVVGGTFGTGQGREMVDPLPAKGTYTPVLVTTEEAVHRSVWPFALHEALLRSFVTGSWPESRLELVDPRDTPPWRVRAGAVCIDGDRVLVNRGEWERGPFYEIPGGGVEAGETPEEAVVRELEEEAGILGSVERELAAVWKDGREEHYFLVRADGRSDRDVLDLEPGFTQEWIAVGDLADAPVWPKRLAWRIAEWHAAGAWPERPVELIDTIGDLAPPCHW
ncbi:MAG TPA: NUDIX domain-containing protein [Acidimicrobiales bacterium]|nr:NUDIX domain-containing protein [Acidimicrobiales bacterium]